MNPKCYQSAILLFSGSGSRPGEICHIIGSLWIPQPAGIRGITLGFELAPANCADLYVEFELLGEYNDT